MSAYINVEKRNAVFAELKGELYSKFRKENISVEWCLKTEQLLTFAISKARTQKDIDVLRNIIMSSVTEEEKQIVRRGRNAQAHHLPKNAELIDYKYATAFEALIGYLYLTKQDERLKEIFELLLSEN